MTNRPNYEAWNWDYREFPDKSSVREKISFFLKAGILAPSLHNTQPWNFTIDGSSATIFPDWARQLKYTDPKGNHLLLSIGCCIANIEIAAAKWRYKTTIHVIKDSNNKPIIRLTFKSINQMNADSRLTAFITKRYSNKLPYVTRPIPSHILTTISRMHVDSARSFISNENEAIRQSALLQQKAAIAEVNERSFAKELGVWLKPNNTHAYDGMPGFVVGLPPPAAIAGKFLIPRLPALSHVLGKKDYDAILGSPAIGLIAVSTDNPASYIAAGRLYERVALYLTSQKISCTPLHSIAHDRNARPYLVNFFKYKKMEPRFFFRMGYSNAKPYHTPRRPITHVLEPTKTEQALTEIIQAPIMIKQMLISGYTINYAVTGKGKPLVLIHGGNIGWGQWYPNIAALAKRFTVYAIDLPGGGRSSRVDFAAMDLQKDLVDVTRLFIKKLRLSRPHIVGSSIGGWTAMNVTLSNQQEVDKLVLVDAIGFTNELKISDRIMGIRPLARFMAGTLLKPVRSNKNLEMFMRDVFHKGNFPFPQEFIEYFYETMKTSHNLLFINRLSGFTGIPKELDMADRLHMIRNNTLVIWGKYDKLTSPERVESVVKLLPHGRFVIVGDAGHIPSIEKSEEFNKLVMNFLDT